jgi:hypothetical protein
MRAVRRYGVTHLALPSGADPASGRLATALENARREHEDRRTGTVFWAIPHREWAAFPAQAMAVPDLAAAVAEVARQARTPGRRTAVIETEGDTVPVAPGRIIDVFRGIEELRVVAEAMDDTVLVVNDAYWPGWSAFVDGEEVEIVPADALVRAVPWPRGRHTLVMRYEPPELRAGMVLSVFGLASVAAAALALRARGRRRAGEHGRA